MIIKNHISWNNNYENDGILYFAQRIVEMLDYRTIDLYRVPLSNTPSLIKEYINVYRGAAKAYNLEQIYHEFVRCYETDIILQEKFGDAHIAQDRHEHAGTKHRKHVLEAEYQRFQRELRLRLLIVGHDTVPPLIIKNIMAIENGGKYRRFSLFT